MRGYNDQHKDLKVGSIIERAILKIDEAKKDDIGRIVVSINPQ